MPHTLIPPPNIATKHILIIEDNAAIADFAAAIFVFAGATVQIAPNSRDGLRVFYETEPDLIVIDADLPGLDGWQVCDRIRQFASVPIILLTDSDEAETPRPILDHPADNILSKPLDPGVLLTQAQCVLAQ